MAATRRFSFFPFSLVTTLSCSTMTFSVTPEPLPCAEAAPGRSVDNSMTNRHQRVLPGFSISVIPPIFPDILPLPLRQGKTPLAVPAHGPTQKAALSRQSCLSVVSVFGEKPLIEAQKRPGICIRGRGKGSVNGHCRHRHRSLVVRPRGLASFSGSPVCPPRPGQ